MKVLIKNAKIISSTPINSPVDILIDNGIISNISKNIVSSTDEVIERNNLHVSVGWMDCFANFCDPGYENKETLKTGADAAAAGGYTNVMLLPDTNPSVHGKSQVEYIVEKSKSLPITIYPIGAVTKNLEGKQLSEMYDMHHSGAIAFSDGLNSLQSSGIMLKALEYIKAIDCTIIQVPFDKSIAANGLVNEGVASIKSGLPGSPSISEEILLARDIELLRYTNSRIHFTGISTKKSIELIAKAKNEGLKISCSVAPYHFIFL